MNSNKIPRLAEVRLRSIAKLYPVVLITGARQVGKTFLAKTVFSNHDWVLLDSASVLKLAKEDPALFLKNHPAPVIFDEVQKAGDILPEIKALVDTLQVANGQIILTGSQPLQVMKAVTESLAGRVGILELATCTPSEINNAPDQQVNFLELAQKPPIGEKIASSHSPLESLLRGGFPAMVLSNQTPTYEDLSQRFSDYIATYLTRDLRDLTQVKDLGKFERWLRILATSSAKIANISELAGLVGLSQSTADEWLGILKASLIILELPGFNRNLIKRETKRSKIFLCDSGLMCNLMGYFNPKQIEISPYLGFIFETAVLSGIRANLSSRQIKVPMFHWRNQEKDEVDLVLELSANELLPIEVKYNTKPDKQDLKGLYQFMNIYEKECKLGIVITPYEKCYWLNDKVLHIPWGMI